MAESDFGRLTRLMLAEFKRVHERFDASDARFDSIEPRITNIEVEMRDIRKRLETLDEAAQNTTGFAKEIDHLLKRVVMIEKHLGLEAHIKG